VVPFGKMGLSLKDVFWKKLQSMLPNLKSFDSREIIGAMEKEYLDSTKPDEKKQKEFVQQITFKRMEEMNLDQNRQIKIIASAWASLTSEQVKELLNLTANFQQRNTNKPMPQQGGSSTEENKQRTKTKAELKDTSKSMAKEESISSEDGTSEQQLISTKGKKQTQNPIASKTKSMKMSTLNNEGNSQQESRSIKEKQKAKRKPKASKLSLKEESVLNDEVYLQQQDSKATRRKKQTPKAKVSKSRSKIEDPLLHESRSVKGKKQNPERQMKDDNSRAKRPRKKTNIKQENENSPQVEAGKKTF